MDWRVLAGVAVPIWMICVFSTAAGSPAGLALKGAGGLDALANSLAASPGGLAVLRAHQPYSPSTAEVPGGIWVVATQSGAWPGCQDAT